MSYLKKEKARQIMKAKIEQNKKKDDGKYKVANADAEFNDEPTKK